MNFYAASLNVTITAEGPSTSFFEPPIIGDDDNKYADERKRDKGGEKNSEERELIPLSVSAGRNMTRDNFSELRNSGFVVDDNNEPVPENIPVDTTVDAVSDTDIDRNFIASKDWVFGGVDQRRTSGAGVFLPPN